jgi:hypothetical protein
LKSHNEITKQIAAKNQADVARLEALTIDDVLDSNPHLVHEIEERLATNKYIYLKISLTFNSFDPYVKESADAHGHGHH